MTDNHGYSLIELLVVISVIMILTAAMAFNFQGWMGNYRIESQTKTLYTDLINTRARAMQTNRDHFVDVKANNYRIFEDTNENGVLNIGAGDDPAPGFANQKPMEYASAWTGTIVVDTKGTIDDIAGTTSVPPGIIELKIDKKSNTPDYDCIALSRAQIKMGQVKGGACEAR